jgi:hypothetical protein
MPADAGDTGKAGVIVAPEDATTMDKLVSWGCLRVPLLMLPLGD